MKTSKENTQEVFECLSIVLTGFSKTEITVTGLLTTYCDVANKELGEAAFNDLLSAFQSIKIADPEHLTPDEVSRVQELVSNATYQPAIAQLIQLWYLGEWVDAADSPKNYMISSQAYLESFIWKAIGTHPSGGKQPGYGTWAFPPLTFSDESTTRQSKPL